MLKMQQDAENLDVSFVMFHLASSLAHFPVCEEENRSEVLYLNQYRSELMLNSGLGRLFCLPQVCSFPCPSQ